MTLIDIQNITLGELRASLTEDTFPPDTRSNPQSQIMFLRHHLSDLNRLNPTLHAF